MLTELARFNAARRYGLHFFAVGALLSVVIRMARSPPDSVLARFLQRTYREVLRTQ